VKLTSKLLVPADFRKALAAAPKAHAQWSDLTSIARTDFISWIDGAKRTETRRRRIERACAMLAEGKRRPCCYSIVPLDVHLALKAAPIAKAQWSDLSPTARREFLGWIAASADGEKRTRRIEKACTMLAEGRRHP
jgi:uncharacterized protein YdeI (YjbR/CyaY-like superfamily)